MTAPRGPTWKGEKCTSVHAWESAPLPRHAPSLDSGKQAVRITLVRKRAPRKGAQEERYVCKWYKTSGVMQTGIGGSKYIYREWSILSSVRHPNIVAYKDFSYDPNGAGLAKLYLEYCPRGDLSQHLKKGSRDDRLNYREGLQVLEQLTQAILYIHHGISRNGDSTALAVPVPGSSQPRGEDDPTKWVTILHRDIKPGNVFIAERNASGIMIKLGDFGISKFEPDGTDTYLGSKNFMAPEQRNANRDGRRTTTKSDMYALGVTVKQVTRSDSSPERILLQQQSPFNQHNLWSELLNRLTHEDYNERPESGAVMDMIQTSLHTSQLSTTMLSRVVSDILEFETAGLTNSGKKRAKKNLASNLLLCRRLLLAGAGADGTPLEKTSLLWLAVAFKKASLEVLGIPEGAESPCPGWKGYFVDELISSLRQHGAIDTSDVEDGSTSEFDSAAWSTHHNVASPKTGQILDLPSISNDTDTDRWFHKLRYHTHSLLYDRMPKYPGRKTVRVAIIDSGISKWRPDVRVPMVDQSYSKLNAGQIVYKDFTGSSPTCADNDAKLHGTWCASLLMQVAPRAELYVANVVQPNKAGYEAEHVAAAISWATDQYVDIISISFGWKYEKPDVAEQIDRARQSGILIFASPSNDGEFTPDHVLYPASDPSVYSIYSCCGSGRSSDFNPRFTTDGDTFLFPGEDLTILDVWDIEPQTGISFATPIAAGTAALVLETARLQVEDPSEIERRLKNYKGMSHVFRSMSSAPQDGGCYYVRPWTLLGERKPIRSLHGPNETHQWYTFIRVLQNLREFGPYAPLR